MTTNSKIECEACRLPHEAPSDGPWRCARCGSLNCLPVMTWPEIRSAYRLRDLLLWGRCVWRAIRFAATIHGDSGDTLPDGSPWITDWRTALSVGWTIHCDWPGPRYSAALSRACRARGYACVPFNLAYQMPRKGSRP